MTKIYNLNQIKEALKNIDRISIFGAGIQGRMQLEYLKPIVDCGFDRSRGPGHSDLKSRV